MCHLVYTYVWHGVGNHVTLAACFFLKKIEARYDRGAPFNSGSSSLYLRRSIPHAQNQPVKKQLKVKASEQKKTIACGDTQKEKRAKTTNVMRRKKQTKNKVKLPRNKIITWQNQNEIRTILG